MAARIEPTQAQLEQAFRRRWRAGWPANLQTALAQPLYAALLRADAVRIAVQAGGGNTKPTALVPPILTTHHSSAAWPPRRAMAPQVDRKRAAAGDRDDD